MKIHQKEWQLQKLGITKWELKYPAVLCGEVIISIPTHIRLLIITKYQCKICSPIINDVLRALHLNSYQVWQLTSSQLAMLPKKFNCNSWRLGVTEKIFLNGIHITSPDMEEFIKSPIARRIFWQKICKYENFFMTA